jgi:DNA-binding response OmpR family regulator
LERHSPGIASARRGVVLIVASPPGGRGLSEILRAAGYTVEVTGALVGPEVPWAAMQLAVLLRSNPSWPIEEVCETCSAIRREAPNLPVIVLGPNDVEAKVRLFRIGADDYIVEPFDRTVFLARIDSLIRTQCTTSS